MHDNHIYSPFKPSSAQIHKECHLSPVFKIANFPGCRPAVWGGIDRESVHHQQSDMHYLRSDIANCGEGLGRMKLQDKLIALHLMATFPPGNRAIAPCFMHGAVAGVLAEICR
jgi:hypothetical protein